MTWWLAPLAVLAQIAPVSAAQTAPEQRVAPDTSRVVASDGAWALRVGRSATGLQCATVGQVVGGAFGLVGLDGTFRALPEANADTCAEPGTLVGTRIFDGGDVRSVVYGVGGPGVEQVTVTLAGRKPRVVAHSAEGGFVFAFRGYPEDSAPSVTLRRRGGATRRFALSGGGFVVPDPYGGRAWRLTAFAMGTKPTKTPPRTRPGCVNFATARVVAGEPSVSSPAVCGLEAARPGVKLKPLYFQTRRVTWRGHAARVAVWGIARGRRSIVVRAGAFRQATKPMLSGGFLVFLPPSTKPEDVSVQVDGRRYGSTFGTVHAQAPPARSVTVRATSPDGRLADGRYAAGFVHYRVHRARVVVRVADPAGGLPWALRAFDAERVTVRHASRTLAGAKVISRNTCVQLGRLQGSAFGWVYGDGQFRAGALESQLLQCTGRKRPRPVATLAGVLAGTNLAGSVVWGLLPGVSTVSVSGTGAADGPAAAAGGAFLRVGGPGAVADDDALVTGDGRAHRLGPRPFSPRIFRRLHFPTLIAGSEQLEAPAPDPSGGPAWGMQVAATREGTPCVPGPTRIVDGRAGAPDLRLGLFWEHAVVPQACRPLENRPNTSRPCDWGTGGGNAEELELTDAQLARARRELRLQPGRTTISATCTADVERVTLRTPRDVRTLVPSATGHAVLAVYDGLFVDGTLELTAHLRGGKTWTQRVPLGF